MKIIILEVLLIHTTCHRSSGRFYNAPTVRCTHHPFFGLKVEQHPQSPNLLFQFSENESCTSRQAVVNRFTAHAQQARFKQEEAGPALKIVCTFPAGRKRSSNIDFLLFVFQHSSYTPVSTRYVPYDTSRDLPIPAPTSK
jgi:hypothetical protein